MSHYADIFYPNIVFIQEFPILTIHIPKALAKKISQMLMDFDFQSVYHGL